jgi:transketolase
MRYTLSKLLLEEMQNNNNIFFLTADLGYKIFDPLFNSFPTRVYNTGAAEQLMLSTAVGLALDGKMPVVYSITPFLLYRPFEIIRNYIDNEKIKVVMIGAGRDKDYMHDGFSHWAEDDNKILDCFKNIKRFHPDSTIDLISNFKYYLYNGPSYINLKR